MPKTKTKPGPNMYASLRKEFPNHPLTSKENKDYIIALTLLDEEFDIQPIRGATHTPAKKRFAIDLLKSAYLDHGFVEKYQVETYEAMCKLEKEGKELEPFHKELMAKEGWHEDYMQWKKNRNDA